jgi:hypothetical protein
MHLTLLQPKSPSSQATFPRLCLPPGRQDHKRQFSPQPSPTCHYLRGWSPRERPNLHLRGCPLAPDDSRLTTCPKMTFVEWTQPIWRSPLEVKIGISCTMPTQSSIRPPTRKWNKQRSWRIPVSNHSGPEGLATNADVCFKAFETFQEPAHASSSHYQASQMTEKSLTAKLFAIINRTSRKRNVFV